MAMNTPTSHQDPRTRFWVPSFYGSDNAMKAYRFMVENPRLMDLYEHFALEALQARRRFGTKLLTERIRWEVNIVTRSKDPYKICNTHTAYIARWLVARYPELKNFLTLRQTRSDTGRHE